jgi:sulfate adenylyltransferase
VASEITKNGGIAICAPIAPYEAMRQEVRAMVEPLGGFILVHTSTPLEVCESRDRKGLYAKARAGIVKEFTGISDPYEAPASAEVRIDTSKVSAEAAAEQVLLHLQTEGYLGRRTSTPVSIAPVGLETVSLETASLGTVTAAALNLPGAVRDLHATKPA